MQHPFITRRNFAALLGAAGAMQAGGGAAQIFLPKPLQIYPTVGNVRVTGIKIDIVPVRPQVSLGRNTTCLLGVNGGFHIRGRVAMQAVPNSQPATFGVLRYLQLTHFFHERTPSFLPGAKKACAHSIANWELDGQYPYLNRTVVCGAGLNSIELADNPNVETELPNEPDETLKVQPADRFQTWLIWETTDNSKPATPTNPIKPHPLARIDWLWTATAGNTHVAGSACDSTMNSGNDWNMATPDSNARVIVGPAAGMPPPLKSLRFADKTTWYPC